MWLLEAAEAVCGALGNASAGVTGLVLDGVASLIDKSLVQQVAQEGEQSRLVMLETIREYGLEVLIRITVTSSELRRHPQQLVLFSSRKFLSSDGAFSAIMR